MSAVDQLFANYTLVLNEMRNGNQLQGHPARQRGSRSRIVLGQRHDSQSLRPPSRNVRQPVPLFIGQSAGIPPTLNYGGGVPVGEGTGTVDITVNSDDTEAVITDLSQAALSWASAPTPTVDTNHRRTFERIQDNSTAINTTNVGCFRRRFHTDDVDEKNLRGWGSAAERPNGR
jgi:hypothetical protein